MHNDPFAAVGQWRETTPVTGADRERAIELLSRAFASDRLEMDELDRRLADVYRARCWADLDRLLVDPADPSHSLEPEDAAPRIARGDAVPSRGVAVGIMGGFDRSGPWVVPRQMRITALMGGVSLDLSQARISEGVTRLEIFAMWGGVDIIVPDGLRVEVTGMAVMGGFGVKGGGVAEDPSVPVLRVSGLAFMGGVEVRRKSRGRRSEKAYRKALDRARSLRSD